MNADVDADADADVATPFCLKATRTNDVDDCLTDKLFVCFFTVSTENNLVLKHGGT